MWRKLTLLTDRAVQFATATTFVFSDSVLYLGGISTEPVKAWESKIGFFFGNTLFFKMWIGSTGTNGIRVDNFSTIHYGILGENQKMMTESKCEPEHFQGSIIFMSMYNDVDW